MRRFSGFAALGCSLLLIVPAAASDPTGIYAVIEKVTHFSAGNPDETVRIDGVFAIAFDGAWNYTPPMHGYLYYKLKEGKEASCRNEWADLKRVAGTGVCVALASRYRPKGVVRRSSEKPNKPDAYPLNFGVRKMGVLDVAKRKLRPQPSVMAQFNLAYYPRPASPADAASVPAGKVTLAVHNPLANDENAKFHFGIQDAAGNKEASQPISAGKKQTTWTPKMQIKPGGKYTWLAWVTTVARGRNNQLMPHKGPVAVGQFNGKKSR